MAQQKNQNFWSSIANEYDKNVGEKGDIRHEKIINPLVFKLLGNLKNKIVLDAGSGNGYLTRMLAKVAKKVIGVDFTKEMISISIRNNNPSNVKFIEGSLEQLPFSKETFDCILCNMALMDVEKLGVVVGQFNKVLKMKGIIVVSVLHPCFENPPKTYSLFDDTGTRIGRLIKDYFKTGLIKDLANKINDVPYQHYHYMISDYLNTFARNNFYLEMLVEPSGNAIDENNNIGMNSDAPTFLIMKFKKIT